NGHVARECRSARARDTRVRGVPRLDRGHPRHPNHARPAGERAPLPDRARGSGRRPDRPRIGWTGADADNRTGIAAAAATVRAAAAIETAKAWCHESAAAAGVPMADAVVCTSRTEANAAIAQFGSSRRGFVVKQDGLAGGKGVTVFDPSSDPVAAAASLLDELFVA